MGNNEAFSTYEATVLACYNHGVLTLPLLEDLTAVYRDVDIDSGGLAGTLSKDGKYDIVDIVILTSGQPLPKKPELPENYPDWTAEQDQANGKWQSDRWELFNNFTSKHW